MFLARWLGIVSNDRDKRAVGRTDRKGRLPTVPLGMQVDATFN
jgi:hypothetical protein